MLVHGHEAAILEMPPYDRNEPSPEEIAAKAVQSLGLVVKFLLCTHAHLDHLSDAVLLRFRERYPNATVHLQNGFKEHVDDTRGVRWFDDVLELSLGGEPLFLIHAPKHSVTDTMVVFRGTICTGDWELRTIRSVNDSRSGITTRRKLASIDRLIAFVSEQNNHIHQAFSVHANDRREALDFVQLMEDTRVDRVL